MVIVISVSLPTCMGVDAKIKFTPGSEDKIQVKIGSDGKYSEFMQIMCDKWVHY